MVPSKVTSQDGPSTRHWAEVREVLYQDALTALAKAQQDTLAALMWPAEHNDLFAPIHHGYLMFFLGGMNNYPVLKMF